MNNKLIVEKLATEIRNLEYLSYIVERGGDVIDPKESFSILNTSMKNIENVIKEISQ